MNVADAVEALAALAHETRLAIHRMLVEAGPNGLPAGVIAERLSIPPSSLTFHLQQLFRAQLATQRRASRQLIYAAGLRHDERTGRIPDGELLRPRRACRARVQSHVRPIDPGRQRPHPEEISMKRVHVHVSVDDLALSTRFYSTLFAAEPRRREAGLREMDAG